MLTTASLPAFQQALADAGLDGWLLYDFRGTNPIAAGLVGIRGMVTRRIFVWLPRTGTPVAITHAIEQGPWADWPREWNKVIYSSWRTLEEEVARHVRGKRIAMEYSPGDAVPYVDRVPAGVLDMVRAAGAKEVVTSGELVTRFYARWTEPQLQSHLRAAEIIAGIAQDAFREAGRAADAGTPLTEFALQHWILERFARAGVSTDHGPNVSVGANAANPHYEPTEARTATIERGQVLLIDLWAVEPGGIYADQTWMASLGEPGEEAQRVWAAIRDGRDAAIDLLRERLADGGSVRGADADDAARAVIVERGFGDYFTHRTGHSIDLGGLHGSGPHLDNLESREERLLVPGVGFSIEPGIYIPGRLGMRTEVNGFVGPDGLIVTPREYQKELIVV